MSADYPEVDYAAVAKSMVNDIANEIFIKRQYESIIDKLKAQRDAYASQLEEVHEQLAAMQNSHVVQGEIVNDEDESV